MPKWEDIVHRMFELETSHEHRQLDAKALRSLKDMPAFMVALEGNYRSSGVLKRVIKTKLTQLMDEIVQGAPVPEFDEAQSVIPIATHLIQSCKVHAHAADATVCRWATVAEELSNHWDVIKLFAQRVKYDKRVEDLILTTLSWTISECNRRKCFIMPYRP
jgi:hypothetical protein